MKHTTINGFYVHIYTLRSGLQINGRIDCVEVEHVRSAKEFRSFRSAVSCIIFRYSSSDTLPIQKIKQTFASKLYLSWCVGIGGCRLSVA
jgi:hypothetical protein